MIAAILLTIVPLVFPVVMQVLGLLTGVIQAYIFAILAIVYISSAAQVPKRDTDDGDDNERRK
jgi:F-type H+-transporting ATPase subunit a